MQRDIDGKGRLVRVFPFYAVSTHYDEIMLENGFIFYSRRFVESDRLKLMS